MATQETASNARVTHESIFEDITEKQRAELRLRETRDELVAIYDGMTDGILVAENSKARVLRTNPAMCQLTGYSETELLRMSALDLFRASQRADLRRYLAAPSENTNALRVNVPLSRKDGSIIHCDVARCHIEYQGRSCTAGFFRDVTDRKHAEAVLARSEARFRALFDGAALGIVLSDREGRLIECNETFAHMIDYRPEELLGRLVADFTHPDDLSEERRKVRKFFDGNRDSLQLEKRLLYRNGSTVWCRVTLSFLPEPHDRHRHVIGVVENITDRKLVRQALRESEQMLRGLVDNLPDLVLVVAHDWTLQFANREPLDKSLKKAIGKNLLSSVPPEHHEKCAAAQERLLATGEVQAVEIRDNHGRWWAVRMVPFEKNGKTPQSMLLICTDVTDQKTATEAVHQEQESLRKMLDLFERDRELVAFEIHDGFSQQLTGALLNFEAARQARPESPETSSKSFDVGLRLLRDSLAESQRLVRGLRPPVLDEFGIVPAIEHLIEDHHASGGGRVEFTTSGITARLAPPLESALFRTVQETLNNARKYSRSDRIRINLSQDTRRVRVEIRDWGVGFDPEKVGNEHFGLRGIRERARLLGGTAEIQAKPSEGTRIRVQFPALPCVAAARPGQEPSA